MNDDDDRPRPYVLREDEGDAYWFLGGLATVKAATARTRGHWGLMEFLNPPGFATPVHRHGEEDEAFYILAGTGQFHCDGQTITGGPGDFLFLPHGLPHAFVVGPDEPLRVLQLTGAPSGFDQFVQQAGEPARERRLPDPSPFDPEALGHAAARHGIEILGPPPGA